MDDETVFGVGLYRRIYMEVLARGWLVYYRIIAPGFNDVDAVANALTRTTTHKGELPLLRQAFSRA